MIKRFSLIVCLVAVAALGCAVKTKLRYLSWETSYEQIDLLKKLVAAFEQRHPDITIQIEATTGATRVFLTDAAAGVPPDVMYVTTEYLAQFVDKGVVLPLDELIARDNISMSIFLPQTVKCCTFDNKLYAYPIHFSTDALFYNKRIFDERHVPYPDESWTWQTYFDAATTLTIDRNGDGRIDVFGALAPDYGLLVASFGGKVFNDDLTRCVVDSPEGLAAFKYAVAMYGRQAPTAAQAMDTNEIQLFANQKLAMYVGRTWMLPQLIRTTQDVSWDVAPVPKGKTRCCMLAVGGNCIALGTQHQEAAWEFVKFYSSIEGQELLGLQKNCTPALDKLAHSSDYFLAPPPASIRVFLDAINYAGKIVPDTFWGAEFGSLIWQPAIEHTRTDRNFTPAMAIREVQQRANEMLENIRTDRARGYKPEAGAGNASFLFYFMVGLMILGGLCLLLVARTNRRYWEGYMFISPWLVGFILFTFGPVLASLYLSFCRYDLLSPPHWTGLENLRQLFADPLFGRSLLNTLYYCALTVPLSLVFSLLLALMLNVKMRGSYTFRAIYYLPALTSGVAVSLLWRWIFNPDLGLFNSFLGFFGVKGPDWLTSPAWAMPAIIIMSVWGALGGPMLIYLAGLQGIPQQLYEAADIDGANRWQKFRSVTVPMLSPSIFFNLIMAIIGSFQVFTTVFVMTSNAGASIEPGGPENSTLVYVLNLYQTGFRYLSMGKACAMAWILFLIILALTLWNYHMSRRWVHYEQT
ncbi:MAG: extracellular solute-binding protein [bacterium]|nr:extracellular solute-binding protein [Candidatus Sumerlaeota bacterium]